MPFWLHEPKVMLAVKGLSLGRKIGAITCVASIFFCGCLFLCYMPLQKSIVEKTKSLNVLATQKGLFEKATDCYDTLLAQHSMLDSQFKKSTTKSRSAQKTINAILKVMRKHDISCRGIQPLSVKKKDFYEKHYVLVNGRGSFKKVLAFLHDIKQESSPIKYKSVQLTRHRKNVLAFTMQMRIVRVFAQGSKA